jgi:phospholipase/carboxylesterase
VGASEPVMPIFLTGGRAAPLVPAAATERLASLLQEAGADVTRRWQPDGHTFSSQEVDEARRWLAAAIGDTARNGQHGTQQTRGG